MQTEMFFLILTEYKPRKNGQLNSDRPHSLNPIMTKCESLFQMRSSLNTTTGSLNKSGPGLGGSVNLSTNLTSSMSLPVYSTEYDDEVKLQIHSAV